MTKFTLIIPYYRNMKMLAEQMQELQRYPEGYNFIVVDDASPEPAEPIILANTTEEFRKRLQLYRILDNIPWNRGGARNLGSKMATTEWLIHVDIDHLLPADCAKALLEEPLYKKTWYRFPRFRRGIADETRKKDKIPDDQEFGEIHPHIDSYLVRKDLYWATGGYDEDYSGCLGGGSPFLKRLSLFGKVDLISSKAFLVVYTRSVIDDASDNTLSRDRSEYSRRQKEKTVQGRTAPINPLRFIWSRVL